VTAPVRRPVPEREPEDTSGRTGCIAMGGILGVIAGALFVFFGLPPLLDAFFGPADIAAGHAYSAEAKSITVESVAESPGFRAEPPPGPRMYVVSLRVRTNVSWHPALKDFELELQGGGSSISALPPSPDVPSTDLTVTLGQERVLILRFPVSSADHAPRALRLRDPNLRFLLPPVSP
jgi:hypothetical protein